MQQPNSIAAQGFATEQQGPTGLTHSAALSRGSGTVVESPILDPLVLHQEDKEWLDTHVQRKWLQLLWGLPRPVHSSLEQSVPALPGFLACTALQEATDHQRPLFKAERRQGLERHLREKMVHCKWGLPERIKRALQLPFPADPPSTDRAAQQGRLPAGGWSAPSQPGPAAASLATTTTTTTTTTKTTVADGSRSLQTAFPGKEVAKEAFPLEVRPFHLAVPREQLKALLGAERGQLDGGLSPFQPGCSSSPPDSIQAIPPDGFWRTPEDKGLSRLNPQREKQGHPGPTLCMSHGGSPGSLPLVRANSLKRRPAVGMRKLHRELEASPQRTGPGGPGGLLQASRGSASRVTLVTAEERGSRAPEGSTAVFYMQEKSRPTAPTRQGTEQTGESTGFQERKSPGTLAVSPGPLAKRDLGLVHQESPDPAGQPSLALSQEGLWEPECICSLEGPSQKPSRARIASRAVLKGDSLSNQAVCFHESVGRPLTLPEAGPQDRHTKAHLTDDRKRYFELHLREKLLHQRWGFPRRLQAFLLQPTIE